MSLALILSERGARRQGELLPPRERINVPKKPEPFGQMTLGGAFILNYLWGVNGVL
jgi:hypothetical protein